MTKYGSMINETTLVKINSISKNLFKFLYVSSLGIQSVTFFQKNPYLEIRPLENVVFNTPNQTLIMNFIYSEHF